MPAKQSSFQTFSNDQTLDLWSSVTSHQPLKDRLCGVMLSLPSSAEGRGFNP